VSKARSVLGEATDTLYNSFSAVHDAVAGEGNIAPPDLRPSFMIAMRVLAAYVALGDGTISPQEAHAISDIFWLDAGGDWITLREQIEADPGCVDEAIATLGRYAALLPAKSDADGDGYSDNAVCDGTALVLRTILAADVNQHPEVERLTEVLTGLRLAAGISGSTGANPVADAPASNSVVGIMRELDGMVGLSEVKQQVETLSNLARIFSIRRRMGLPVPDMSFHLVFLGNPGTGKTTVARVIARLYGALGLLSKGHLVEVDRSGLVAGYIGQTESKVQEVIASALGGVLFIDEAYALEAGFENDFGKEAVATLLKAMEDHRDDFVVIAAGYTDKMQGFLQINPGLRSRMPRDLTFANYSPAEMAAIFVTMVRGASYSLPENARDMLTSVFEQWDRQATDFANARDVRNAFERVIAAQANRLASIPDPDGSELQALTAEDLRALSA
jgi:stage V sporulation protein K